MEEWRAIDVIKRMKIEMHERYVDMHRAFDSAINALEEVQRYRAIGTVEEFKQCRDMLSKAEPDNLSKIGEGEI